MDIQELAAYLFYEQCRKKKEKKTPFEKLTKDKKDPFVETAQAILLIINKMNFIAIPKAEYEGFQNDPNKNWDARIKNHEHLTKVIENFIQVLSMPRGVDKKKQVKRKQIPLEHFPAGELAFKIIDTKINE